MSPWLEAGSVRAKNTKNILLKNVLDACLGGRGRWMVLATASTRMLNPRCMNQTASSDVASNVLQSLGAHFEPSFHECNGIL